MHAFIDRLIDWALTSPIAQATGMSVIIGVLRTIYDSKETTWERIILEGLMCGLLTLVAGSAVKALGLPLEWVMVIGGTIAFIGVAAFRRVLMKYLNKKAEGDGNGESPV